jgi:extracellular elastinolytic metalloproteinase
MSREVDRRDLSVNRATSLRKAELRSLASDVSHELPGTHQIRIQHFNTFTGNPAAIVSENAPAETGNYIQRAIDHVQNIGTVLGFEATQAAEYTADPHLQQTSSDAVTVHLQQQYKGIPIFQAAEAVRFNPEGAIQETVGSSVTVAGDLPVAPRLSVLDAVLRAAQHVATPDEDEQGETDQFGEPIQVVGVDLTGFSPQIITTIANQPNRVTILEAGPFGDKTKANLVWFPLQETLHLSWEVILTMPGMTGQFRTLVDAETGEILYCRQLMEFALARGNVYRVDGSTARQMVNFPLSIQDYGLPARNDLPPNFPGDWVDKDQTVGNSTYAHLGDAGRSMQGKLQDNAVVFDPADPTGDDQKILNIFYYNCYMHDYFYQLGFREAEGNFQQVNFGRGGFQSDRVDARAHSGAVQGTANMYTPVDGSSPVMNMGLVTSTNRHTAFDSSVVFHEFAHGVTNRLVGGPMNDHALEAPQSRGMGEGWSDYIACTINNTITVGDWVVNRRGGIRAYPYDSNFPDHFGKLGTGRYVDQEHNIGEIWCATLMELNRKIGAALAVQLVVDALKLSPANPSFLDMRDAILKALDNKRTAGQVSTEEHATTRRNIWIVFAKLGMGPGAKCNGATTLGIVADFKTPEEKPPETPTPTGETATVEASPNLAIPDNQPDGITSVLPVLQTGQLIRITVAVDIAHTYIGDLQISLITPTGKTVVLHSRTGASADNLVQSYRSEDIPELAALAGESIQGNWTLKVADLAGQDTGTLRHWNLAIAYQSTTQTASGEAKPELAIPDNDPTGISSTIAIAQSGNAQEITLNLDITHTYIGDLRVKLLAPSGQEIMLHERLGGGQDNLIRSYDSTAHLAPLLNQPIQGNWVLQVADLAGRDVGKFNTWNLSITYR